MDNRYPDCQPELWAGPECSIVRIGASYRDQSAETGHYHRVADVKLLAGLNIKKVRYPILWEHHEPVEGVMIDWSATERTLEQFKSYKIEVIAGLLHHGSGPLFTSLDDIHFPTLFANYAGKVAMRFPHIKYYTPINEPLTTARFSGLYGFWYPHHKSELSFFRILINQLTATVLAMREIRKINPTAQLIQTEDLAEIQSNETLLYQAQFENERKWITYDFLCAKIRPGHFFWDYLLRLGIPENRLNFFIENPCPPDCTGFNYYITSERFLDERIEKYPDDMHGGNGTHRYVDTELVRVGKIKGPYKLLKEAWERFNIPLAITECHLHCTREEQLRWIQYCWQACQLLIDEGILINAFTIWSVFGSYDWNSLLTQTNFKYELGAFDVTGNMPRPTAIAHLVKNLGKEEQFEHPLVEVKGWWERDENPQTAIITSKPLLVIGSTSPLARAFIKICQHRCIHYATVAEMNVDGNERICEAITALKPWAVINTVSYSDIDMAENDPGNCFDLNVFTTLKIAEVCAKQEIPLMTFSTDQVFNGDKNTPYTETDTVDPVNTFGKSKALAERLVLNSNPSTLVIRSGEIFGPWEKESFAFKLIESIATGGFTTLVNDVTFSPTYLPDLVNTALDLFIDGENGIWHIVNEGKLSVAGFGQIIASQTGNDINKIKVVRSRDSGIVAARPAYTVLESKRGVKIRNIESAIAEYVRDNEYRYL